MSLSIDILVCRDSNLGDIVISGYGKTEYLRGVFEQMKKKTVEYMIWGKLRTGEQNRPFIKLTGANGLEQAKRKVKNCEEDYDDVVAYRWSSEDHSLNYNPNHPEVKVTYDYMNPITHNEELWKAYLEYRYRLE